MKRKLALLLAGLLAVAVGLTWLLRRPLEVEVTLPLLRWIDGLRGRSRSDR